MGKLNASKKLKTDYRPAKNASIKEKCSKSSLVESSSPSDSSLSSFDDSSDEDYERKRKIRKKLEKKRRQNCALIMETISTIENKIGVCPCCRKLDNGTAMIGTF